MRQLLFIFSLLLLTLATARLAPAGEPQPINVGLQAARVYFDDSAELNELSLDVWDINLDEQYAVVGLDQSELDNVSQAGFDVEIDPHEVLQIPRFEHALAAYQMDGIPGFSCYRTVEETFSMADTIVATYPNLAQKIDIGDSWRKLQGHDNGYDINVLRLSRMDNNPDAKPKLMILTSLHAREYTTAELGARFAEYLVENYGTNADATWVLDHHDIHWVMYGNPDGRKIAEQGVFQRKNINTDDCISPVTRGVDLNRNFPFEWGNHNGSSGNGCNQLYRGPSAGSEPETQAILDYGASIFGDHRDAPLTAAAADDTPGIFLDIHSYSELVLWAWGFTDTVAPNGVQMQTLGRKLAYFNDYAAMQAIGLYPTDGTTDDYFYGELGVASYTYELGTEFFQQCSVFEDTILPENLPSLMYAAKSARTPYMTPAGPDAINVSVSSANVAQGQTVTLTATLADDRFKDVGSEPTQSVASAVWSVDKAYWEAGVVENSMAAADGAFDDVSEAVSAVIDTSGWAVGKHMVYVRGKDSADNWGTVSAVFIEVLPAFTESLHMPMLATGSEPVSESGANE